MGSNIKAWEWVFAISCGLVGAAFVLRATSRYGMGVSSDSMYYISSADNFLAGKGFVDFGDQPLTDFPPLYPFILAVARGISGVTPFVWARFINSAVMLLLIASTGVMFLRAFPGKKLWFVLGTLATLVFYPLYTLAAMVSTDLLYILFSLWFCLGASLYLESKNIYSLVFMIILAACASMLRWVGLAFIVTLFLLVLYSHRRNVRSEWWVVLLSSGIAGLPLVLWVGYRNFYSVGTIGRMSYAPDKIDEIKNFILTINRLLGWATPYPLAFCLGLAFLFLVPILLLNRLRDWNRFLQRLLRSEIAPMLLLSSVYLLAVILTGWTADHLDARDDRYQVPLYAAMLLAFFVGCEELLLPHLSRSRQKLAMMGIMAVFIVWGGFQAANLVNFVRTSRGLGVGVYNEYNNRQMIRSPLVVYLIKNRPAEQATLYSNVPEAVYFFLGHPVKMAPWDPENYYAAPENLLKYYADWQPGEQAYLIFFKPNYKRHHYSPDDIATVANLEKIFKDRQGDVYRVRPKE